MRERKLEYYMALPHRVELVPTEDGRGFTARIPDLKGCVAVGETVEDAYGEIKAVKEAWIEIAMEEGWPIPEPPEEEIKAYSGRFNLRLPRYLHRELAETAEAEDTSLNQLVVALLSEGVQRRRPLRRASGVTDEELRARVASVLSQHLGCDGSYEDALATFEAALASYERPASFLAYLFEVAAGRAAGTQTHELAFRYRASGQGYDEDVEDQVGDRR